MEFNEENRKAQTRCLKYNADPKYENGVCD